MKMMLSTPSTISRAVSVMSAIQISGFVTQSMACPSRARAEVARPDSISD